MKCISKVHVRREPNKHTPTGRKQVWGKINEVALNVKCKPGLARGRNCLSVNMSPAWLLEEMN